jgi:hypothetical protein
LATYPYYSLGYPYYYSGYGSNYCVQNASHQYRRCLNSGRTKQDCSDEMNRNLAIACGV